MLVKNAIKPLILTAIFTSILCAYFWTTSRYPELSAKAVIGNNSPLANLGFAPIINVDESFTFWQKVMAETLNWIDTNKKGMSFAFFMGACFLTFLPLIRRKTFKRGFSNSLFGMALGAPLGVCVNCAAPIARALHAAGSSLQTSLSALIASPTLNVVVLVMAFSMFPLYLVAIKLILTLCFILIIIPLACHFLFKEEGARQNQSDYCEIETVINQRLNDTQNTWIGAASWFVRTYIKNFFYLLKIALPFMFLAGFLGALFTTIMPWEAIQSLDDTDLSPLTIFGIMAGLSFFGALLPSPMAFDIILSSALLQAGVPIQYVAVFLFTLGSFSIYAFFIIWRSVSLRVASFLFVTAALLGMVAGLLCIYFENIAVSQAYETAQTIDNAEIKDPASTIIIANEDNQFDPIIPRTDKAYHFEEIVPILAQNKRTAQPLPMDAIESKPDNVTVERIANSAQSLNIDAKPFSYLQGDVIGVEQPHSVSYVTGISDYVARGTMSVAVADVHNDGWPDLLLMGDHEITPNLILYANIDGKRFMRQEIPLPKDTQEAISVALIDLNGDGWKDIVFSTHGGKNYIIYNEKGAFTDRNLTMLSSHSGMTMSMSFADIDLDGDLDIFFGNWSVGPSFIDAPKSKNIILKQEDNGEFKEFSLPGLSGETLTSLFTDFNQDGYPDLYIGNDYLRGTQSDLVLFNDKSGNFVIPPHDAVKTLLGGQTTMSIDSGDIDNDLKPDYYIGQIAYTGQYMHSMSKIADKQIPYQDYCTRPENAGNKGCSAEMALKLSLAKGANYISDACQGLEHDIDKAKCLRHLMGYKYFCSTRRMFSNATHFKNKASTRYQSFCDGMGAAADHAKKSAGDYDFNGHLNVSNDSLHNVLLHNTENGAGGTSLFTDEANQRGVGYGAWTWNARFADLDNDGWQDLYVANGFSLPMTLSTNLYYRNDGHGAFQDETTPYGFENYTPTSAFSFADLDNDGDLDLVNVPNDAPIHFYINNTDRLSVEFSLRDLQSSNTDALGAHITIAYKLEGSEQTLHQYSTIKGSGGFRSFNQPIAHFGLNNAPEITQIKIQWPDGQIQTLQGHFKSGYKYLITRT
tara:strand:- start:10286 stop:13546 length:3261 start_codon:yes stop_codon:yes gene_type:complete